MSRKLRPAERLIINSLLEKPLYGYELSTLFKERNISMSISTIYGTLHRLALLGIVQQTTKPSLIGPAKMLYTLTKRGLKTATEADTTYSAQLENQLQKIAEEYHRCLRDLKLITQSGLKRYPIP
jgi:DNA-binding PadR family transcriptional regulator